jgi:hypothetical protein
MTSTRRFDPTKAVAAVCSAAVPAAAAVALRNHYDWQETAAILDLVAACTVAGVLAGGIVLDDQVGVRGSGTGRPTARPLLHRPDVDDGRPFVGAQAYPRSL